MKSWILLLAIFAFNNEASEINPFKVSLQASHQITLLNYGLGSLEERLQMIEKSKKTIDVEYYIFNTDTSGRIISQALIKKAHEGVKVRMLLDYFPARTKFSPFYAHEMERNGIEVKYFNVTSSINLFKGQYRDHRKVLVIDGEEAITGGRNIADEYFDLREDFNFLDQDTLIRGQIVSYIQDTFDVFWNSENSIKLKREERPQISDAIYNTDGSVDEFRYRNDLKIYNQKIAKAVEFLSVPSDQLEEIRAKGKAELDGEYNGVCENVSFNSEYPIIGKKNRPERIIKHDIEHRISYAKESVLIDSPYFVLNDESEASLENASNKNVKVTLLTNSLNSTDAFYVYSAFDTMIKYWINKGIETYIYKGFVPENYPTMNDKISHARFGLHAKSFVIDNKDSVIGSFNFDPHSANFNAEMTIACNNNPELARVVREKIEGKFKGSIFLDSKKTLREAKFYSTNFLKLLKYYVVKLPSNIFSYLL